MLSAGQVPVVWDLEVQGNLLRMLHRWRQRQLQRLFLFLFFLVCLQYPAGYLLPTIIPNIPGRALTAPHRRTIRGGAKAALVHGLKSVDVFVKGPGSGREAAIRALSASGLEVVQNAIDELCLLLLPKLQTILADLLARPCILPLGLLVTRTRREARQVVGHKHIAVNGRTVNIPSYLIKSLQRFNHELAILLVF